VYVFEKEFNNGSDESAESEELAMGIHADDTIGDILEFGDDGLDDDGSYYNHGHKRPKRDLSGNIWTTRDGKRIAIGDMTDQHLLNTINYLRRWAMTFLDRNRSFYLGGMPPNGEQASYLFEREFDYWTCEAEPDDLLPNIYWRMLEEAERRQLKLRG
jgi:hypothetical protein